ncbi:hypothetical protein PanWU01x14_016740, partial [Parasponia andersonii]
LLLFRSSPTARNFPLHRRMFFAFLATPSFCFALSLSLAGSNNQDLSFLTHSLFSSFKTIFSKVQSKGKTTINIILKLCWHLCAKVRGQGDGEIHNVPRISRVGRSRS